MSKVENYDFSGWATRSNLRCKDGRVIAENAFAHNDGKKVPLVWMHNHGNVKQVLGHAILKSEKGGVRAYGKFNNTEEGLHAKELVHAGDVTGLSIYANDLQQQVNGDILTVLHGDIKELSLVLAGANPGATIDSEVVHGEFSDDSAFINTGDGLEFAHADDKPAEKDAGDDGKDEGKDDGEETVADVFNSLTEKQKTAVYAIVGQIAEDSKKGDDGDDNDDSKGGKEPMKHNAFEGDNTRKNYLSHADFETIIRDAKKGGSLRDAFDTFVENSYLAHDDEPGAGAGSDEPAVTPAGLPNADGLTYATYGMSNVDYLFPEAKALNGGAPEFIKRDTGWVTKVMNGVHHTPFSRIKSVFANITGEEARALGYTKGNLKKDEVFALLKRTTEPTTVYKKQKMDRDDVTDITDFDVIAWIKAEMRLMLDEEFARAFLFGDGRSDASDDKIPEDHIRPAITDASLYTITKPIAGATPVEIAANMIDGVVEAQDNYRGSGNLTAFIKQSWITKMLLLKDEIGHRMYKNLSELATAMSVSAIVKVPDAIVTEDYYGVVLDLNDYNVGADKGGAVSLFDDFDIDYNQQKYLIEARCSGALTKPYSAIALAEAE